MKDWICGKEGNGEFSLVRKIDISEMTRKKLEISKLCVELERICF